MLHDIPEEVRDCMRELEAQEARDHNSLQQIPRQTGRLLALLAAAAPAGTWIEAGTSGGYSSLWISLAARTKDVRHVTIEISESKVVLARQTFARAKLEHRIELVHGDALEHLPRYSGVSFCFIDASPGPVNIGAYDIVLPNLLPGGWLVMDNVVSHRKVPEMRAFLQRVKSDRRVDFALLRFGKGQLVCRRNH